MRPVTVLIVEAEPDLVRLIEIMVLKIMPDCRILTAYDGQPGLQQARQARPDLIITDLDMPRMNGDEMVHLLRQDPGGSQAMILGMSGHDPAIARMKTFVRRCDAFLPKPFNLRELTEKVVSLLDRDLSE